MTAMKVLVPTDFSVFANSALKIAMDIAKARNASVHLAHCSEKLPLGWENWPLREQDLDAAATATYKELLAKLENSCADTDDSVSCSYSVHTGKLYEAVSEVCGKQDIDLVVMGTHGVSGKQEYFVGSNTQKVIRKVHANVLIVKDTHESIQFEEVLFATGLSIDDRDTFRRFLEFIKPFEPKEIHILSIDTPGFFNQPTIVMQEGLKDFVAIGENAGFKCVSHFSRDFTVEAGIRHFSGKIGIDLVAISNHERHPLRRTFRGSTVELLANHAEVPVLSMDYESD